MDLNQDGKVTVDERVRSALLIFTALLVLFGAVIIGGWGLIVGSLPPWRVIAVIPLLSASSTAALLIRRELYIERQEREAKTDLEFRREKERWEFAQAQGISTEAGATTISQAQVDSAALSILRRFYDGKPWSRDACVADGLMSAEQWNEANATLRKRRIRRGRQMKLEPPDFATAWAMYCDAKLKANKHKMGSASDDWREAG